MLDASSKEKILSSPAYWDTLLKGLNIQTPDEFRSFLESCS